MIPYIITLLGHHAIDVVTEALHVVGCIIALERDDKENFDYTEVSDDVRSSPLVRRGLRRHQVSEQPPQTDIYIHPKGVALDHIQHHRGQQRIGPHPPHPSLLDRRHHQKQHHQSDHRHAALPERRRPEDGSVLGVHEWLHVRERRADRVLRQQRRD